MLYLYFPFKIMNKFANNRSRTSANVKFVRASSTLIIWVQVKQKALFTVILEDRVPGWIWYAEPDNENEKLLTYSALQNLIFSSP